MKRKNKKEKGFKNTVNFQKMEIPKTKKGTEEVDC